MNEHLTITRPSDLGSLLDAAARDLMAMPLALDADSLPLISARLACGDHEHVRALLHDARPTPILPLILARFTAWSGDLRTASTLWRNAIASLDRSDELDDATRVATLIEVQRIATDVGDVQTGAQLHRLARQYEARPPDTVPHQPAVQTVFDIAFNLLGLEPDATRGRLRIRPRAERYPALHARHIRMGDARVDVEVTHEDVTIVIRIEQTAGGTPITALLEPIVQHAVHTSVDDNPAELAPQTIDDGVIVPVQLVLDECRTMVIHT